MTKKQLYNALGITGIMLLAFIIYFKHWRYGLPMHWFVDEIITYNGVNGMIGGGIETPLVFNYPHLTFYLGYIAYKFFSLFTVIDDLNFFLRVIICGIALLSNICMFFTARLITGKDFYGFIALLISVFSLYPFEYLYYTGPDVMLYAVANVVFLVALHIYYAEEDLALKLYPLIGILIGLATSAKYHGILLGALWLTIHIEKGYIKDIRNNLKFIASCFLIVVSFALCNWKIFLDPTGFIDGFVFNFKHYAMEKNQGVEHNIPVLGYFETWVMYGFGLVGSIIFMVGIWYCLKNKSRRRLAITLLTVPVIIFIVLCRYRIVLGRNISQIAPVYHLFIMFGVMAIAELFHKYKIAGHIPIVLVGLLSLINIIYMVYINGYKDSYTYIENWIAENIEDGATIYLDNGAYDPVVDSTKYNICSTGPELSNRVPTLQEGEYYITSGLTYYRYIQQNDFYFLQSGYLYPEDAEFYYEKVNNLECVEEAESFCTTFGTNFRLKYLDIFSKNHDKFFAGPTIKVYTAK